MANERVIKISDKNHERLWHMAGRGGTFNGAIDVLLAHWEHCDRTQNTESKRGKRTK